MPSLDILNLRKYLILFRNVSVLATNCFALQRLQKNLQLCSPFIRTSSKALLPVLLKITHSEKHSVRWQVLFPTKYAKTHLLQGRDPLRVTAMFFKRMPNQTARIGHSVAGPVCLAAVWDQMRAPCVHARLSKPHRLVPVEPRPLVHSSNLISRDFITSGGRRMSEGSHLEKYNCLSALTFELI